MKLFLLSALHKSNPHRVVSKPRDVSLVSGVEEYGSTALPVLTADQIALLERFVGDKVEMVQLQEQTTINSW